MNGRSFPIVKISVLASSSAGNSTLVATERTCLLVDAGLSRKETFERLAAAGVDPESLDAILITHEHNDHINGLQAIAKKLEIPVYLSRMTAPAIDWGEFTPRLELFQAGSCFTIGDIDVTSFTIPHDAIDPVGFAFEAQGVRIAIATDLGYIPESVKFHLRRTDLLLLEANHDLDMLKVGPYPWAVKQRVMSRVGHLSNLVMSDYLEQDLDAATCQLVLGHLSEQNNHPAIVHMMATQALDGRGLRTRLSIASQHTPSAVFQF